VTRCIVLALLLLTSTAAAEPMLGVTVDAGVPDGAGASFVIRPVSRVRLHGGVTHNAVSAGARGGITVAPFKSWFTPTVSFDYGVYAEGDANPVVQKISGDSMFHSAMLERVGYHYANAHLGLEFGRKRATFYLHAGISRVSGQLHNLSETGDSATTVTFSEDPAFTATTVSARIGLVIYLL
jgi:hypothetical protein